eukprot:862423-Alexandrium_andersonii.AAC.1
MSSSPTAAQRTTPKSLLPRCGTASIGLVEAPGPRRMSRLRRPSVTVRASPPERCAARGADAKAERDELARN